MDSRKRRIVGILIIFAGLASALPFQRVAKQREPGSAATGEPGFHWRRPDSGPEMAAQFGRSPAEALFIVEPSADLTPVDAMPGRVTRPPSLDLGASLPELPADYQPLGDPTIQPSRLRSPGNSVKPADPPIEFELRVVRHKIVDGDTLMKLASRYLGQASRWQEIFAENRDVLESPDLLPIDQELVIVVRVPQQGDVGLPVVKP